MLILSTVLLISCITNCFTIRVIDLVEKLSYDDNLVDLNNGFAVKRIGSYSPKMSKNILHTFISLDNFCQLSTGDAICKYTSSSTAKINIMELSNLVKSEYDIATASIYNKETISDFISKDLITLMSRNVQKHILKNKTENVHYLYDKFHFRMNNHQSLVKAPVMEYESIQNNVLRFKPTAIDNVLKQVNNNRISFDYLSINELQFVLTIIFSNLQISYKPNNLKADLDSFSQLVIAQSVYAVRHCGMSSHQLSSIDSCVVVSTLFNQVTTNTRLVYPVYRLIPLPIIIDGKTYIFSNVPKIFATNALEQIDLIWDPDENDDQCTWSPIVSCNTKPKSISPIVESCLHELLNNQKNSLKTCELSRSDNLDDGFMSISDGVLFSYKSNYTHHCEIYSKSNEFIENFSTTKEAIIGITCNQTITCSTFQYESRICSKNTIIIESHSVKNFKHNSRYIIPSSNMTKTLMQTYDTQLKKSINEFKTQLTTTKTSIKQALQDFGFYLSSTICSMILIIFILIINLVQKKLRKEINDLDDQFQDYINP